jgi:hypothetical protein
VLISNPDAAMPNVKASNSLHQCLPFPSLFPLWSLFPSISLHRLLPPKSSTKNQNQNTQKKKKINPDTQNSKIPMTTRMQCTNTDSFITLQLFGNEGEGACFC